MPIAVWCDGRTLAAVEPPKALKMTENGLHMPHLEAPRAGLSDQKTRKYTEKYTRPRKSVRNSLKYVVNSQNV